MLPLAMILLHSQVSPLFSPLRRCPLSDLSPTTQQADQGPLSLQRVRISARIQPESRRIAAGGLRCTAVHEGRSPARTPRQTPASASSTTRYGCFFRPAAPKHDANTQCTCGELRLDPQAIKVATAVDAVLKARSAGNHGRPVLAAAAAVLEANPDVYTLWNVRREAFERGPGGREAGTEEIALVARCLAKQPKCYPAWHHRQWLVEKNAVDVDGELTAAEECALSFSHGALRALWPPLA